jgi:hypothetical protein
MASQRTQPCHFRDAPLGRPGIHNHGWGLWIRARCCASPRNDGPLAFLHWCMRSRPPRINAAATACRLGRGDPYASRLFERRCSMNPRKLRPVVMGPASLRDDGGESGCEQPRHSRIDRHCERSEAIHGASAPKMDCFAALAMTGGATGVRRKNRKSRMKRLFPSWILTWILCRWSSDRSSRSYSIQ